MDIFMAGISVLIMIWIVVLYSCLKVSARADRIAEAFLIGEEEHYGNQSESKQIKEAG